MKSDELSLIIVNPYESPMSFDAKKQKLVSSIASSATAFFNVNLLAAIPEKFNKGALPRFDCRIFEVPDESEATNSILWREKDAIKNSVSMLAQHHFSHKLLQNKSSSVMRDMLKTEKSVLWEDQPNFFKSGTYVKRIKYNKITDNGETAIRTKVEDVHAVLSDMEHEKRITFVMNKYHEY